MAEEQDQVDNPSLYYQGMAMVWQMFTDLMGGTFAMREAGERWLPREEKEEDRAYKNRVKRSVLFNALKNTIKRLTSKPFSKAVTQKGTLPEPLQEVVNDVDRTGLSMHDFARQLLEAGIEQGITHVLIDFPKTIVEGEKPLSLGEEREQGARPILIHVKAPQLLGWQTERKNDGSQRLKQVRIHEKRVEQKGAYGEQEVEYVRVFTTTKWELWRRDPESEEWAIEENGTHTFGEVPLVTFYVNQTGFLTGEPPLEDLAHLNIAHWDSSSDQRQILSFSRMPLLFGAGFSDEQVEGGITVGPRRIIHTENEQAKLEYVEHTGAAIEAGERDLNDLEERMEVLGLQPFIQRSSASTATGKVIDETKTETEIQAWIRALETVLVGLVEASGIWIGITKLPTDFGFDINNDFGISQRVSTDLDILLKMVMAGKLSHKTFLQEVKRRGLVMDTVDPEVEIEDISREVPGLEEEEEIEA